MKNDTRLSPEDRDENKPGLNDNGISRMQTGSPENTQPSPGNPCGSDC